MPGSLPRTVTAFPAEFIERQWDSLKAVASVAEKNAPLPPMRLLEPLALNETMLRFPEAQKRAREGFYGGNSRLRPFPS